MTADLMPFDYEGQQVRTVIENDEPRFVGADVAAALGYSNSRKAIGDHVPEAHRGVSRIVTPSGEQQMTTLDEAGLYRLIMRANTEPAERFQEWVTATVLPTIRKTGSYAVERLTPLQLAERLVDAERRVEAAAARARQLEGPAAQAEVFRSAEGLCTIGDLANRFKAWALTAHPDAKVLHKQVFDHAGVVQLIIRGDTIRHNQPTSQAIKAGWVIPHRVAFDTNTRGMQTKVSTRLTPTGEARLWDHLVKYIADHGSLAIEVAA